METRRQHDSTSDMYEQSPLHAPCLPHALTCLTTQQHKVRVRCHLHLSIYISTIAHFDVNDPYRLLGINSKTFRQPLRNQSCLGFHFHLISHMPVASPPFMWDRPKQHSQFVCHVVKSLYPIDYFVWSSLVVDTLFICVICRTRVTKIKLI